MAGRHLVTGAIATLAEVMTSMPLQTAYKCEQYTNE